MLLSFEWTSIFLLLLLLSRASVTTLGPLHTRPISVLGEDATAVLFLRHEHTKAQPVHPTHNHRR